MYPCSSVADVFLCVLCGCLPWGGGWVTTIKYFLCVLYGKKKLMKNSLTNLIKIYLKFLEPGKTEEILMKWFYCWF